METMDTGIVMYLEYYYYGKWRASVPDTSTAP